MTNNQRPYYVEVRMPSKEDVAEISSSKRIKRTVETRYFAHRVADLKGMQLILFYRN